MTPTMRWLLAAMAGLGALALADSVWRATSSDVARPLERVSGPAGISDHKTPGAIRTSAATAPAPAIPGAPSGQPKAWPDQPGIERYQASFAAPLFSAARRRAVGPANLDPIQPIQAMTDALGDAQLVGVAFGHGAAVALVSSGGSLARIEPGDQIGQCLAQDITASEVIFDCQGETRRLAVQP